jgi:hypothetical protein
MVRKLSVQGAPSGPLVGTRFVAKDLYEVRGSAKRSRTLLTREHGTSEALLFQNGTAFREETRLLHPKAIGCRRPAMARHLMNR